MREVMFRGLGINGKDWHVGNLSIINTDLSSAVKRGFYISNSIGMPFAYQVRPETIGQNTGLKDNTGKEIFDGDIVRWRLWDDIPEDKLISHDFSPVVWDNDELQWAVDWRGDKIGLIRKGELEIIGNIYENPELLK